MQELIVNIAPNLASKLPDFYKALGDTMLMVLWSGLISFVFGLLLGVVLTVTKPNGILENKVVYQILDKLVSLFRSIPFIILLTWVMPITRALVGTVLYVRGAIVPLVFGSVPFFTRQVESALAELDGGLIEAALSMGSSPLEIIFRVYLKESIAAIARGTTITLHVSEAESEFLEVWRVREVLERVQLADKMDHYPNQLSGGQQQRVAIARAVANNPTILLADEPTGALDQNTGRQVMELFHSLNEEGRTIIMITHDSKIAAHAQRIVRILDGNISAGGLEDA